MPLKAKLVLILGLLFTTFRLGAVELDVPVFAGAYGTAFYADSARLFEALRPGVRSGSFMETRASRIRFR